METWTCQGHVVGMLDRDQRTAKMFTFDRHVFHVIEYEDIPDQTAVIPTRRNKTISHDSVPGRTSPHSSCKTRKNGHFWKSLHRLKHALIVGTYLSLVTFPSISSAATIRNPMSRQNSEPKWLNPCGMGGLNGAAPDHRMPDAKLINQIVDQAQIVEARAKTFKEDFVRKTFNMDAEELHNYYKKHDYHWLPTKEIPKQLNEQVPQEHLESLEFKPTLLKIYSNLQRIAVGMEQVVWDEEDRNGEFKSSFVQTEDYLRTLLCEIYTAIIEKDLTIEENVSRDIMEDKFRNMDNTNINIRNWIIYRDYLNMLEYIIQVFNHFKTNLKE